MLFRDAAAARFNWEAVARGDLDAIRDLPVARRRFSLTFRPMSEDSLARIARLVAIPVRSSLVLREGKLDELEGSAKKLGDRTSTWPGRG